MLLEGEDVAVVTAAAAEGRRGCLEAGRARARSVRRLAAIVTVM